VSRRSILIAVPAHSGAVACETATSLMRARDEAHALGCKCEVDFRPGDSLLLRARNVMVARFLKSDADDLVFWDADVAAAPGGFAQLISHPVDCVAGPYRFRAEPEGYPVRYLSGRPAAIDPASGLLEIEGVGAGFLRVGRGLVERLIAADPDGWVDDRGEGRLPWLFDFAVREHQMHGEDFVFCDKVRAAGAAVWLDTRIALHHVGPKAFGGDFNRHLGTSLAAAAKPGELAEASAALEAAHRAFEQR